MSFLKNVHDFLEENRTYGRKFFTPGQWSYIQETLDQHQYMIDLLRLFSDPSFDRMYDVSVIEHEGIENHIHDRRYKTRHTLVLTEIQKKISDLTGDESQWEVDQEKLTQGFYRRQLLSWPEILADTELTAYVNFLFEHFEKADSTTLYWPVCLSEWAGRAVDKEPFIGALRDSQKAYEEDSSEATYENKTYSCMIGLEQRIGQFYDYLYREEELPFEEQPLAVQYVKAVTQPFVESCAEQNLKPTELFYALYLEARFGSYEVENRQTCEHVIEIPASEYPALREQYAQQQWLLLEQALSHVAEKSISEQGVVSLSMRQCMQQPVILWRDVLVACCNEEGRAIIFQPDIIKHLKTKFDKNCQDLMRHTVTDDRLDIKINSFGLRSYVTETQRSSHYLVIPNQLGNTRKKIRQNLKKNTPLTKDWLELIEHLPGAYFFDQMELWVDQRRAVFLSNIDIKQHLGSLKTQTIRLEKLLVNASMAALKNREIAYADYCYAPEEIIHYINNSIEEINPWFQDICDGFFIFAQDTLTSKYLTSWLGFANTHIESLYYDDFDNSMRHCVTMTQCNQFIAQLLNLGFDKTVKNLIEQYSELCNIPGVYVLNDASLEHNMLECLAERPMKESTAVYFKMTPDVWEPFFETGPPQQEFFHHAIISGNVDFLEAAFPVVGRQELLKLQKNQYIESFFVAVIKSKDPAMWQWLSRNFSDKYEFFAENLTLEQHPVIVALHQESYVDLARTLKIYPQFLRHFLIEKEAKHPNKGIDIFFNVFAEPLSQSILTDQKIFVRLFIQQQCYQDYLFSDQLLIVDYFHQALLKKSFESAKIILEEIAAHIIARQIPLDKVTDIFEKLQTSFSQVLGHYFERSEKAQSITVIPGLQQIESQISQSMHVNVATNWLDLCARFEMTAQSFEEMLKVMGLQAGNPLLKQAIDTLWTHLPENGRNNLTRNFMILLSYGHWPHSVPGSVVVARLMRAPSLPQAIKIVQLCYATQPALVPYAIALFDQNQYSALGVSLVNSSINRLNWHEFDDLASSFEQNVPEHYSRMALMRQAWCQRWASRENAENISFDNLLMATILQISQEKAEQLNDNLWILRGKCEKQLWAFLQEEKEVSPELKIELLIQVQKKHHTLESPFSPNVLVESVLLGCSEIANKIAQGIPRLLSCADEDGIKPLKKMMRQPGVFCCSWVLQQPAYRSQVKDHWHEYTHKSLSASQWDKVQLLLKHSKRHGWLNDQKLFNFWRAATNNHKREAATLIDSIAEELWSTKTHVSHKLSYERLKLDYYECEQHTAQSQLLFSQQGGYLLEKPHAHKRRRHNS